MAKKKRKKKEKLKSKAKQKQNENATKHEIIIETSEYANGKMRGSIYIRGWNGACSRQRSEMKNPKTTTNRHVQKEREREGKICT